MRGYWLCWFCDFWRPGLKFVYLVGVMNFMIWYPVMGV